MPHPAHPAVTSFIAEISDELLIAQVLIKRMEQGYELRHQDDRNALRDILRALPLDGLRKLAETSAAGAFRPLKSAPTLPSGWVATAANEGELGHALDQLYPGAVADWFASRAEAPPLTHYREFTARQTGMYRVTTFLNDEQAARMIQSCCNARFCLKRRLWTVAGLAPDRADQKSIIPCLEPCAVLLEFARKTARLKDEPPLQLQFGSGEMESIQAALEAALQHPDPTSREADFGSPANPRRMQLLLEIIKAHLQSRPVPKRDQP